MKKKILKEIFFFQNHAEQNLPKIQLKQATY